MGRPQFIPSSYRAYAVDFDGDGKTDIWENDADVIGSVANYLSLHGWRRGEAIAAPARGVNGSHDAFIAAGMKPSLSIGELRRAGINLTDKLPDAASVSLIELEQPDRKEYWAGLQNFYVITRYNHSNLYAMAVYQLSREILDLQNATRTASAGD
jgi:membrane-bound lytic murein transglycosylase B